MAHMPFFGGPQVELAFVDEQDGYALGWESKPGDVEEGHSAVLFTSDGGRHWQAIFVSHLRTSSR